MKNHPTKEKERFKKVHLYFNTAKEGKKMKKDEILMFSLFMLAVTMFLVRAFGSEIGGMFTLAFAGGNLLIWKLLKV